MSTIDELMTGKAPGSIKVCRPDQSGWFQPFFKARGEWVGRTSEDHSFWDTGYSSWTIYTEPKPTKVVYEWMVFEDRWYLHDDLFTEKEAEAFFAPIKHKKTGREFTVECE